MAKYSTMYNYANKYISEKISDSLREEHFYKLKAFIYMNISGERDADKNIYARGEELFAKNAEFRNLVVGCLGCMKNAYGNDEDKNCDFDDVYRVVTHDKHANLDKDFQKLDRRYQKAHYREEEKGL